MTLTTVIFANAAEPPAVTIIVLNPPEDISCELVFGENSFPASYSRTAWEGYFTFYYRQFEGDGDYKIAVSSGGERYEIELPEKPGGYRTLYTLDIKNQVLTPGEYPLRSVSLVGMRLIITLIIEGALFFLFGYRHKRSWLIFLLTNLITQGLLNIALNTNGLYGGYPLLLLIFGEILIFAAEMVALPLLLKEKSKPRAVVFAVIANAASLFVGGWLVMSFPV